MIQSKIWGDTSSIEANSSLEFHRIEIKQGGVCSKHIHQSKWNGFFVESGKLCVRVWKDTVIDETILSAGQYTKVKPGQYHQFEALENTVAFEIYWAELKHEDIQRETIGYIKEL